MTVRDLWLLGPTSSRWSAACQPVSAIGLILAAKGIIRYAELKKTPDQKVAEYVLIGTMLSMVWAVLVGLAFCRFAPVAR